MDTIHENIYERLAQLPPDEMKQMLRQLIPPASLAIAAGGTLLDVSTFGLRKFQGKASLPDLGIPDGDPRASIFSGLKAARIDPKIANKLRAISAREETVGAQAGAQKIWAQGRKVWFVPTNRTTDFMNAIGALAAEFAREVDEQIVSRYDELRTEARHEYRQACQQAWDDMHRRKQPLQQGRDEYVDQAIAQFDAAFPSREEVASGVRMEIVTVAPGAPRVVQAIWDEERTAYAQALRAQRDAAQAEFQASLRQAEMFEAQKVAADIAAQKELDDQALRRQLLADAIAPEVQAARGLAQKAVEEMFAAFSKAAESIKSGQPVSPQAKRAWQVRLESLKALAMPDGDFEAAIEQLGTIIEGGRAPTDASLNAAQKAVQRALNEITQGVQMDVDADAMVALVHAGRGEDALRTIFQARAKAADTAILADALRDIVVARMPACP